MDQSQRMRVLTGIFLVLAVVAAGVWYTNRPGVKPPPSAPGYYTGPMKSKGDPTVYGTDDGVRVPAPAGASQTAKPTSRDTKGKGGAGP